MEIVNPEKANETNNVNTDENDDDDYNEDEHQHEQNEEYDSDSDGDDEDSLELTNMDVYKEVPRALKRLDEHLSIHTVLLNNDKKKKRILQCNGKSVKRIMGLMEHTFLAIRLKIEKRQDAKSAKQSGNESDITGSDDAFPMLSIIAVLFQFELGECGGGANGYLTAVCNFLPKQIRSVNILSQDNRRYAVSRGEINHLIHVVQKCLQRVFDEAQIKSTRQMTQRQGYAVHLAVANISSGDISACNEQEDEVHDLTFVVFMIVYLLSTITIQRSDQLNMSTSESTTTGNGSTMTTTATFCHLISALPKSVVFDAVAPAVPQCWLFDIIISNAITYVVARISSGTGYQTRIAV